MRGLALCFRFLLVVSCYVVFISWMYFFFLLRIIFPEKNPRLKKPQKFVVVSNEIKKDYTATNSHTVYNKVPKVEDWHRNYST